MKPQREEGKEGKKTRTRPNAYGETINRKGQRNDFYRTKNCVYPWLDYIR